MRAAYRAVSKHFAIFLLRLRRLAAHYRAPLPILSRSLLSLNLYAQDKILGLFPLHDVICQDMIDRGIARVIVLDPVVLEFVQGVGRPIFEWIKVGSWNRERRREQIVSNQNCLAPWEGILSSALLVDQSLSERLQIESSYIFSYCLSFVVSYQVSTIGQGGRVVVAPFAHGANNAIPPSLPIRSSSSWEVTRVGSGSGTCAGGTVTTCTAARPG